MIGRIIQNKAKKIFHADDNSGSKKMHFSEKIKNLHFRYSIICNNKIKISKHDDPTVPISTHSIIVFRIVFNGSSIEYL